MKVLAVETQSLCPIGSFAPLLLGAGCEIVFWRPELEDRAPSLDGISGVLALGGAANPDEDERYPWLVDERALLGEAIERRMPTLGICLGAELLSEVLGGRTARLSQPQIGWFELSRLENVADGLSSWLPRSFPAFEWHSYAFSLPPDATLTAGSTDAVEAFSWHTHVWGFQFHLEADAQIIGDWAEHYSETLLAHGIEPTELLADTARLIDHQRRCARCVAHAFATEIVRYGQGLPRSGSRKSTRSGSV